MLVDFNKEMRQNAEDKIPSSVVDHMNLKLPDGLKYEMDDDGNLVLTSTRDTITIGKLQLECLDDIEEKIGKNPSMADILQYSYNAQKELRFKPANEDSLNINGQDVDKDKIIISFKHSLHDFKDMKGEFIAVPKKFPPAVQVKIGCEQYCRELKIQRIPNDSLNEITMQSQPEEPLQFTWTFNRKTEISTINISVKLKYAKTIRDIVESIFIYNAFVDDKLNINGQRVKLKSKDPGIKRFNDNYARFWEETLKVEDVLNSNLNVGFIPPKGDLDEDTISMIEELYQCLILKNPVRRVNCIDFIKGASSIKDELNLDEIKGHNLFVVFGQEKEFDVFNATFKLLAFNGILDAVVSDYKINGDQVILYFEKNKEGEYPTLATIDCLNEEEMRKISNQSGSELANYFQNSQTLDMLVEAVFE